MNPPRSTRHLLLLVVAFAALACSKDKDRNDPNVALGAPDLGEPIGAELPARGSLPALSLAIAVSKERDPVAVMPKVAGHVSSAVAQCPAFVTEAKENVVALNYRVEGGKMKMLPGALNDDDAGVRCVSAALEGKEIASSATPAMNGRVEIKLSSRAITTAKP